MRRADRIHPKRPTCEEERPAHRRRPRDRRARRRTAPPEMRAKNWRRRRKPVSGRDQAGRKPSARAKSAGFRPDTAATHRPRRVCERAAESAPRGHYGALQRAQKRFILRHDGGKGIRQVAQRQQRIGRSAHGQHAAGQQVDIRQRARRSGENTEQGHGAPPLPVSCPKKGRRYAHKADTQRIKIRKAGGKCPKTTKKRFNTTD